MSDLQTLDQLIDLMEDGSAFLRFKEDGNWCTWTYAELYQKVVNLACGIHSHGLKKGSVIGMVAPTGPYALAFDLACQALGIVTVPLFATLSTEHFLYQIQSAQIQVLVASELSILAEDLVSQIPAEIKIWTQIHHSLQDLSWFDLCSCGDQVQFKSIRVQNAPQEVATIHFTSGSLGEPKGVPLSHQNLCAQLRGSALWFPLDTHDTALSVLPMAHIFERMVLFYLLYAGVGITFSDDIQKTGLYLKEFKPTIITIVPRILEKMHAKIKAVAEEQKGLKRKIFLGLLQLSMSQPISSNSLFYWVLDLVLFKTIRAKLGGNLKYVIVGGARLNPQINQFFMNIGIPVFEGYGLTECAPVVAVNTPFAQKIGTVGRVFPGVELQIAGDGEILVRGESVFKAYLHENPYQDWFTTGDLGTVDAEGFLKILGRKKELLKTANGKYISPLPIEQGLLLESSLIEYAVVIAEGKPFVTALLFPNVLEEETGRKRLGIQDLESFWEHPKVLAEINLAISLAQKSCNSWEMIRKWKWIYQGLGIASGELSQKMMPKREVLSQRFATEIAEMYLG